MPRRNPVRQHRDPYSSQASAIIRVSTRDTTPAIKKRCKRKDEDVKDPDSGDKPRRKAPIRGRRGILVELLDLPLELISEIFSYLQPLDLLYLARTNKGFRRLLMTRSSIHIWKEARGSVPGFPDCPRDLTEPQYARLAFDPHCYKCGTTCQDVIWQFRARYCKRCQNLDDEDIMVDWYRVSHRLPRQFQEFRVPKMLPSYNFTPKNKKYANRVYHAPDMQIILAQIQELIASGVGNEDFIASKIALADGIKKHSELCQVWKSKLRASRGEELAAARQRRKDAIYPRLVELGWRSEIDCHGWDTVADGCKYINEPKDLTEAIWNNIRPSVAEYMHELVWYRLNDSVFCKRRMIAAKLWQEYAERTNRSSAFPSLADVVFHPSFFNIIEGSPSIHVDAQSFQDAVTNIPFLIRDCTRNADDALLALFPGQPPPDYSPSRLLLAITAFSCTHCKWKGILGYPDILEHHCLVDFWFSYPRSKLPKKERKYWLLYSTLNSRPRKLDGKIEVHKKSAVLMDIVRKCGMDPSTTTAATMDKLQTKLACGICSKTEETVGMSWRKAVKHIASPAHPSNEIEDFEWINLG